MKRALFILILFCSATITLAQNGLSPAFRKTLKKIDELSEANQFDSVPKLLLILNQQAEKLNTNRARGYYNLYEAEFYKITDTPTKAHFYAKKATYYAQLAHDTLIEIDAILIEAYHFLIASKKDSCIYYAKRGLALTVLVKNQKKECNYNFVIGKALYNQGNVLEASNYYRKSLELAEKINSPTSQVQALVSLAFAYEKINIAFSFTYLRRAEKLFPLVKDKALVGNVYNCMGNCYREQNKYDSALFYYEKSIPLIDREKDKVSYGGAIGNIGNIYAELGDYDKALAAQYQSIKYFEQAEDSLDIEIAYGTIADLFLKKKDYTKAIMFYKKTIAISERLNLAEELIYNYEGMYKCYEALGKYKEAFDAFRKYKIYNDSLNNLDNAKKLTEQDLKYKFAAKEKEQAIIQKSKDELTQEQLKRQKIIITCSVLGGLIVLMFLGITLRNSAIRKKINKQLANSNDEIAAQKNIIEIKNREITDSITYAARLQQGVLPDETDIQNLLPGSFVFYRPRDIVSGDFYWMKKITGSAKIGSGDLVAVVVADCTGHGVPGAFMSFIGSTILNQSLGNVKVQSPADALYYLNEQLPITLQSKKQTGQINDGMEAGICVIDKTNKKLFFSGANLTLVHIRNFVITELKGDKHAIGLGSNDQHKTFTDHQLQLQKGDCVYLFSDGYADQFGGPKGKKFKYKNLIELLKTNSTLSPEEQYQNLDSAFKNWKVNVEQIDDVMVFGYMVS